MFIQTFLDWLNYQDPKSKQANNTAAQRPMLAAKVPLQIAERSLPTPQRLFEMASDYHAKRQQIANEQYQAFMKTGYPDFIQWLETCVEKSAALGGHLLLLTFDNSTGIVTAAARQPHELLPPIPYALPLSQSALQKLADSVADYFQKANFLVRVSRQESTSTRLGASFTPAYDCLDIVWAQTPPRSFRPPKSTKRRKKKSARNRKFIPVRPSLFVGPRA